jgi:hypothetical protein
MGGSSCAKILLNNGGVIGLLTGINNVIVTDGDTLPPDLIAEGEKLICGFHEQLEEYEKKLLAAVGS